MTGNTTPHEKVRALFLAAIMVLSVFGMTAAFAGSAAADVGNVADTSADDVMIEHSSINGTITLEDVENDGATDTLTIDTSSIDADLVNNVSASSETFSDVSATVNGDDDIEVSVPDDDDTGNISLDVDYNTTVFGENTTETASVDADSGYSTDVSIDFTSNLDIGDNTLESTTVATHGQEITVSADITNNGDVETTETVDYDVDDSSFDSTSVTIGAGETETVEFTFNTDSLPGADAGGSNVYTHSLTANPSVSGTLVVGQEEEGSITANIQDNTGSDLNGANVSLYYADDWNGDPGSSAAPIDTKELGDSQSTTTFDNLALGNSSDDNSHVEYVLYAEKKNFESDTTQEALHHPNNDGPTRALTLESALEAQHLEIARVNSDGELVSGDQGSLLADGESANSQTFAVVTQNQADEGISGELEADLDISDEALDLDGIGQGDSVGDFIDNETLDQETTVTINGSDTATVDDSFDKVSEGEVSYATFDVTADNATRDWLESNDLDPIADQPFDAEAENESGDTLSDSGDVTYFLKGDRATQHQVADSDGDPVDNATVWVAYEDAPQELDNVEDIVDQNGDDFLVAETNEDGNAVIDGIIGTADTDSPSFNVYVQEDGYNIFNSSTETTSDGDDLATETAIEEDYYVADYEVGNHIEGDEGSGEDDVYSHVLYQTPQAYDLNVTVADEDGDFVKSTEIPDTESREVQIEVTSGETGEDVEDFTPAANQELDLELLNDSGVANLDDTTVTTDDDGVATTTIAGEETQSGTVNISASTTNADGTEYRTDTSTDSINEVGDQAEVEIFTAANIEGDVVDENNEGVPGAEVVLEVENSTGAFVQYDNRSTTAGSDGSFTFQNVPTGNDYRVVGTFTDEATGDEYQGFNEGQLEDLQSGTTTAGISLELDIDDVEVPDEDVTFQDVLDTIEDYNNEDTSFQDVLDAIEDYNENNA